MREPFDFTQPSRDQLPGIYVEATDVVASTDAKPASLGRQRSAKSNDFLGLP
jgi:hypothetical protein